MIANVLQLGEEERVSLGLLSAWENQLKQMMGGNQPGPNTRPTFAGLQSWLATAQFWFSTQLDVNGKTKSQRGHLNSTMCTRANLDVHVSIRVADGC